MKGFPKQLNSKKDYENVVNDFGYCAKTKEAYQALLDTNKHYVFDRELATESDRDGATPDYKVMSEEQPDETERIVQYKLADNPDSKLKELGLMVSEVEEVINQC